MGMMTCVVCGREMSSYDPRRRCAECFQQELRDSVRRSIERAWEASRQPEYSASPEPETTDWIKPMAERFRQELGIEAVADASGLHTERTSKPRQPNISNDPDDMIGAVKWHQLKHSEEELLAPFTEHQRANLRFYRHMVEIGVVEHQTAPDPEQEGW